MPVPQHVELEDGLFDWEELLIYIEDRRVIPVVGRGLLWLPGEVSESGEEILFERHLAERLAAAFRIPRDQLSDQPDLNEVALRLDRGGARRRIYPRILSIVRELLKRQPPPIPAALEKLAGIADFRLFVSTTFDPLLAMALDEVRFQGEKRTRSLAYSFHSEIADLPEDAESSQGEETWVYQILGEVSSVVSDYAVTDEDTLEFLQRLQTARRPARLFDAFRDNHLLFLGCGFPDWLCRFFIRTIANERLREGRATSQIIVDRQNLENQPLATFLLDCDSYLYPAGDVVEFVTELSRRWQERQPAVEEGPARTASPAGVAAERMESGAVFLSYASQDREAAVAMKQALESAGVEVWFDRKDLQAGDSWRLQLRTNVQRCGLFLPILSVNARGRLEGIYREEWRWAIERSRGIAESVPFIQPVIVDELADGADDIPAEFWARQVSRFPGGRPSEEFSRRAKEVIRTFRLARR
ncbi:MAG: toll/interleukin-1 receptor domain-containing protein [Thermoanaerobaculia bacterium]